MKVYKYVSPDYINKIFLLNKQATLKCSYPNEFNDPYELFLTIDFNLEPEILAFYYDVIGNILQLPTTCFSKSPTIIPMWSHYAKNLEGFVLEIDEEILCSYFPKSKFDDVVYLDKPNSSITESLLRAYTTAKFRHTYILENQVFNAAYFYKNSCWSYELERRMILDPEEIRSKAKNKLIDLPYECISAIICGPKISKKQKKELVSHAKIIGCDIYDMKIGKISTTPFFMDQNKKSFVFENGKIIPPYLYCANCKEPLILDTGKCSWCSIKKSHKVMASIKNPFRILQQAGMLDSYIEDMNKISREHNKKLE